MGNKERIHYIDVAKGILILFVIYGHTYSRSQCLENNVINIIRTSLNGCIPFYMPCFFVITGLCSNFNKPLKQIIWNSFKTILLPSYFISLLILLPNFSLENLFNLLKRIVLYGSEYWFLTVLFISRIIYCILNKYAKLYVGIISITFFLFGYTLQLIRPSQYYWWFDHVLLLIPFLYLGHLVKSNNKIFTLTPKLYIPLLGLTIFGAHYGILRIDYFYHVPAITQALINTNVRMFFPLILLSISGSLMLLYISKKINKNIFLEYVGRNSLIYYCLQGAVMAELFSYFKDALLINNVFYSTLIIIFVLFTTILFVSIVAYILNLKYIKVLIGKF